MRALGIADRIYDTCPWSGKSVHPDSLNEHDGQVGGIRNLGCRDKSESADRHFEAAKESAGRAPP